MRLATEGYGIMETMDPQVSESDGIHMGSHEIDDDDMTMTMR